MRLVPGLAAVGVGDHVRQELLDGEHAVVDGRARERRGPAGSSRCAATPGRRSRARCRPRIATIPPSPASTVTPGGRYWTASNGQIVAGRSARPRSARRASTSRSGKRGEGVHGRLGDDAPESLEAEGGARSVEGLGHPVRAEDERVAGGEVPGPHGEPGVGVEAEGGPALERQHRRRAAEPPQERPLVARARVADLAALAVEHGAGHGDEHAHVVALRQPRVELPQDVVGTGVAPADRAQESGHARHEEGRGHSLVRHVGDGQDEPAAVQQEEVVEVAPDLAGRLERGGDRIAAGQGLRRRDGEHRLLDLARDVQLPGPPLLLRQPGRALLDVPPEHAAHPVGHVPERADLERVPHLGERGVEIAPADPLHRAGQHLERPGDAAGRQPHEPEGQPEDAEADEELPLRQAARLGDQLVAGGRQDQGERLADVDLDRAPPADPRPALDGQRRVPARRVVGAGEELPQRGVLEVADAREDGVAGSRADQSRRIGVGDHEPEAVDERDLGGGGDAGLREMTGQLLERDVGADDGGAGPAPPGERGADLTRREEDVRAGPDERRARHPPAGTSRGSAGRSGSRAAGRPGPRRAACPGRRSGPASGGRAAARLWTRNAAPAGALRLCRTAARSERTRKKSPSPKPT